MATDIDLSGYGPIVVEVAHPLEQVIVVELPAPIQPANVVPVAGSPGPRGEPGESGAIALESHIAALTPHSAYDDISDFALLFENGLI